MSSSRIGAGIRAEAGTQGGPAPRGVLVGFPELPHRLLDDPGEGISEGADLDLKLARGGLHLLPGETVAGFRP